MAGSVEAQQVGYGFKPTDEQLVGHFLKKKLKGEMEACSAIPELYIYDWEPPDLFILYDGLSSESSDGRECFFFCPRGGQRKTERGYWKETSSKRVIRAPDTGEPMGTKRYFVYYEGQQPKGRGTDVSMHKYHLNSDVSDSEISDPTAFVLSRIIKRKSKKAKSATATASTDLIGPSNLNSVPRQLQESLLNPTIQPRCSSNDDNRHVDGPSDRSCNMPYSPSDHINLQGIFTLSGDNNLQDIFN